MPAELVDSAVAGIDDVVRHSHPSRTKVTPLLMQQRNTPYRTLPVGKFSDSKSGWRIHLQGRAAW